MRQFTLNDAGYEHLIRILTGQASVEKNPLGTIPVLPTKRAAAAPQILSPADFKADISRIIDYAPAELIGREAELETLSDAWDQAVNGKPKRPHVLTFVALGGEGKTSLVAKWAADLAYQDWPGCDAAFAWSFYSQGTSEKTQASSDSFLKEALLFFGDFDMANSAVSSFDKGRRLAQLVSERRALLILDGVEPLQYAPTSPTGSELKDQGVAALLRVLPSNNNGLCIVTTRYSIPDVRNFWQTTAPEIKLKSLSIEAGVALLRRFDVKGIQAEFEQLVRDVKGHALTLNLLGSFLRDAHAGDIRKRDLVKLEEAAEEQGGHAFHVIDAYVESLKGEGEKGMRALSVLRLLGLFDRPATADCLNALWTGEEIGGLTGPLQGLSEAQRNITLKRLEDAGLINVNRNEASQLISVDAHPLLREYFASRVREQLPGAWRAAHRRLYEHLCETTKEGDEPTLEDLQPLYQAVAHGCHAGLQQEVCDEVLFDRIHHGAEHYAAKTLGAFGAELGAVACFFDTPWSRVSPLLTEADQAWLLNEAAFCLRALGRLMEALEPMRVGLRMRVSSDNWDNASISAGNLSELELTLGKIDEALADGKEILTYTDRSGHWGVHQLYRTSYADALHQAGDRAEAERRFREVEQMQKEVHYLLLYSIAGFRYCDLLLAASERAAWQTVLQLETRNWALETAAAAWPDVSQRATTALNIALNGSFGLLDIANNHLMLGRAALYAAILESPDFQLLTNDFSYVDAAVDGLRRAGRQDHLPRGLLTRAWVRFLTGARTGPGSAQEDLDEAWEIAERGPMKLYMADIHLCRARLFHAVEPYPWNKFADGREGRGPKDDLDAAEELINKCGYHRRDEELADAREAAKGWA